MSLAEYEDFYYEACLATDGEPVTAWQRQSDEVKRLAEWVQGKEEVRITAPGTDVRLGVAGAPGSPAWASTTCRTESSSPGRSRTPWRARWRSHSPPPTAAARSQACASASRAARSWTPSAEQGEEFLHEMLDSDDGARRLGELGIGTNYGIATGTKEILLDEKIGGTVHMAIGMSCPETGGVNDSAVHWDMVCDLRNGGAITVDGVELQRDGRFVVWPGRLPANATGSGSWAAVLLRPT